LVALDVVSLEVEWLQKKLIDIPFLFKLISSILIHCDSQDTIANTKSKKINEKNNTYDY
jgi:hypothetical protein